MENISEYNKKNILSTFEKPKSTHRISFINDKINDFIYVVEYSKKTGKITDTSCIVVQDRQNWENWKQELGWVKI